MRNSWLLRIFKALLCITIIAGMPLPTCSAPTTNKIFGISPSDIVHHVANLADLRALADSLELTDSSGQQGVYLEGRITSGDGGEGIFRWNGSDLSAEIKNDTQSGIYIAPTSDLTGASGAWVRTDTSAIIASWFGTDSTAINAAIAFGGEVYIPAGTWNGTVTIPSGTTGLVLRGAGKGKTVINISSGNGIASVGNGSSGNWNVVIKNLTVEGSASSGDGIFFDYTYHSSIQNVEIKNCGLNGWKIQRGFYNEIRNVWSHGNKKNGGMFGQIANANNVIGGHYRLNGENGIEINSEGNATRAHGNNLNMPTIESNTENGVLVFDSDGNKISGCYFEKKSDVVYCNIYITDDSGYAANNIVENNEFVGAIQSIKIGNAQNTLIIGNSINYGLEITSSAVKTIVINNPRIDGKITDNGSGTILFHDSTASNRYYIKTGTNTAFSLTSGTIATILDFGSTNYFQISSGGSAVSKAHPDGTFEINGVWNKPFKMGTAYLWIADGKLYIKDGSAPASSSDGTVVGTQF